jgi:hypothetical protein
MMDINKINVELSEDSQRYVNEYCESKSNGKINGFSTGCCKCRGGGLPLLYGIVCIMSVFGERGAIGRAMDSLQMIPSGGNHRGKMEKDGRGRV